MRNDQNKFLSILNEHQKIIFKICHLYTDNQDDFADLYQEIVYQLWKSFEKFEQRSKISTWIYKVSLNTALYFIRTESKYKNHLSLRELDFQLAVPEYANELMDRLKEMIESLNAFEKTLILLQLEGLSYKEIAQISGLSETNVGTKLARIKNKLREMLKN